MNKILTILKCYSPCSKGIILAIAVFAAACSSNYSPKPKEYPLIHLPDRSYIQYSSKDCPFSFEYSTIGEIVREEPLFDSKPDGDCWLNIHYQSLNATVYLSYKDLNGDYSIDKLKNDAHRLTYEHATIAAYIEPRIVSTENNVIGVIYEVGGNAASATQFFVTDTAHHWMRGALYFRSEPNADSLAPLIDYINDDINQLVSTLKWDQ